MSSGEEVFLELQRLARCIAATMPVVANETHAPQ